MLRRGPALPVTTSTLASEDALANMPDDASVRVAHADLPGLTWLLDTPPRGYVVDRLRLKPGASVTAGLRPEVSGSSDACAWIAADDLDRLPLVDLARTGARL